MSAREQTAELLARLERHYIKPGEQFPGGVFVPECGQNGATGSGSRADALYVGFTSTSGRVLVGHELKVSRADWRKELDQAGKADFWADNCHEWWIVALGPEVVPVEEVPHQWGLMYPGRSKTRMQVVRRAHTWSDRQPSWNAMRSILARLDTLRAQHETAVQRKALERAQAEAERLDRERALRGEREALTPEQQRRLNTLEWIERLVGEPLTSDRWDDERVRPEHVAAALRLVQAGDAICTRSQYQTEALERAAQLLLDGLSPWKQAMEALAEVTDPRGAQR